MSGLLPWKNLSAPLKRALWCHILWAFGQALADSFVNVYLFRLSEGYRSVILFQIWRTLGIPTGFYLAAALARASSTAWAYRAGVLGFQAFFLAVLLLGKSSLSALPFLGMLQGLAIGFYWLGWGVLVLEMVRDQERDAFFGTGLAGLGLASIVGGPAAGLFLSGWQGLGGYFWLFLLASGVFFSSTWISFSLKGSPLPKGRFGQVLRVKHPPAWRGILWASYASGIRDGILAYLIALLVYQVSSSEAKLGGYSGWVALLGVAGAWLAGRLSRPEKRGFWMMAGAASLTLATLGLVWRVSLWTLWIYGTLTAFLGPLFQVPYSAVYYKVMSDSKRLLRRRAEYFTFKEIPLGLGRLSANFFVLFFVTGPQGISMKGLLAVIGLIPLLMAAMLGPYGSKPDAPVLGP
jgi:YQGE family putative transporter